MRLTGLHFLFSYQCLYECDHCFVWSGPRQIGVMTLKDIRRILAQAKDLGTVESVYFEGGEPFLYYPTMLTAAYEATEMGFSVGLVTNAYWATDYEDAVEWLRPLAEVVHSITVSTDLYHADEKMSRQAQIAVEAADALGIKRSLITVAQPRDMIDGRAPDGETGIMYKGRAARVLAPKAPKRHWETFTECPFEDLEDPGRVHVDPFGNLHLCQGLVMGNLFERPLKEIVAGYDPKTHPIIGPLIMGGPAELAVAFDLAPGDGYADACHFCDDLRRRLRTRFPETLRPDNLYPES